jgi:hypothetical protein
MRWLIPMRGDEEALVDDFDEQRQLRRSPNGSFGPVAGKAVVAGLPRIAAFKHADKRAAAFGHSLGR